MREAAVLHERGFSEVIIVGAGLIGLAIAFEFAERGKSVFVFERGQPGRGASWAGAGMLAPYTEDLHAGDSRLVRLGAESLKLYPQFVRRVCEASGLEVELRLDGILHAAFDEERMRDLEAHASRLRNLGAICDILDAEAAHAAEPALGEHVVGALLVAAEGYVDNRQLTRALIAACQARDITIVSEVPTLVVECDDQHVVGVRTDQGLFAAPTVVNATGAWAGLLPGVPTSCMPGVYPVKGQILALSATPGVVRRPTWVSDTHYFVPRNDGRVLIGATAESVGFDEHVTAVGIQHLLDVALAAEPSLGTFPIAETWAGLRPGSADGRPFIGPTSIAGLVLAAGHFRNGILLTPITARLVADFVCGGDLEPLRSWLIGR